MFRVLCILCIASCTLFTIGTGGTETVGQPTGASSKFTIAVNTFSRSYAPNEAVPLLVALGNNSHKALYLPTDDNRPILLGSANLVDATGREVPMNVPIITPPTPPPDHFMQIDGQNVLMQKVIVVKAGEASACIIPNILWLYRDLKPGEYTLNLTPDFSTYKQTDIVSRPELADHLWVRADAKQETFTFPSQRLKIVIASKLAK